MHTYQVGLVITFCYQHELWPTTTTTTHPLLYKQDSQVHCHCRQRGLTAAASDTLINIKVFELIEGMNNRWATRENGAAFMTTSSVLSVQQPEESSESEIRVSAECSVWILTMWRSWIVKRNKPDKTLMGGETVLNKGKMMLVRSQSKNKECFYAYPSPLSAPSWITA